MQGIAKDTLWNISIITVKKHVTELSNIDIMLQKTTTIVDFNFFTELAKCTCIY